MKKLLMAAAVAACFTASPAMAQGMDLYATGGLTHADTDFDVSFEAVTGRLGARFARYLAVEGEVSVGFEQDFVDGMPVELSHDAALFGVVLLPMTDNADLFARVGAGSTSIEVDGEEMSHEAVRYGVGAQFFFNATSGVRIDFTRIELGDEFTGDDADADTYSVSYVHKFGG